MSNQQKEYSMLYSLNARLNSSFKGTLSSAQNEFRKIQNEIQSLYKTQSDISAYQKQSSAVETTGKKLEVLKQQYDNIQNEMQQSGAASSELKNKLLDKQMQIDKTSASLSTQTNKLQQMDEAIKKAGIDTANLGSESAKLGVQLNDLKAKQEAVVDEAVIYGNTASNAFIAVGQSIIAAGTIKLLKELYSEYKECSDAAKEYETAIAKVETVAGEATNMRQISNDMMRMSMETGKLANELSEAGYEAVSSGIQAANSAKFIYDAAKLSIAGFTGTATSVDLLTTIINSYNKSTEEAKHIGDILITTQNLGKTTVDRLASSMGMVIPTAAAYKVGLEDISAAYALMTIRGISTERTTTYVNSMLNELGDNSSEVSAILTEMSNKSFADLMAEGKSLGDVLSLIGKNVDYNTTAFSNLWGSQEAQRAALSLLNVGSTKYNETLQQMRDSAGATDKAYKTMADTTEMIQKRFEASANVLKISVGDELNPMLNDLKEAGTNAFAWASEFIQQNPAFLKAGTAAIAVLGTASGGMLSYAAAVKVVKALDLASIFTGPAFVVMGVVAGVAALTAGIVALSAASKKEKSEMESLTITSRTQFKELEKLKAEYDVLVSAHKETSVTAQLLKKRIDEQTAAFEENKQTTAELYKANYEAIQANKELIASYEETIGNIDTESVKAINLKNRLNELIAVEEKTTGTKQEILAVVGLLNDAIPDLGLNYNQYTDSLNKSADAIYNVIKAEIAREKAAAQYEKLKSLIESEDNLKSQHDKQKAEVDAALKIYSAASRDLKRIKSQFGEYSPEPGVLAPYIEAFQLAKDTYGETFADYAPLDEQLKNTQAQIKAISDELGIYSEETEVAGDSTTTTSDKISIITGKVKELSDAYTESYNAALSSIVGQYSLWDEAAAATSTDADTINKAIKSQVTYWEDYKKNLAALSEQKDTINGLSDMIASFADGSTDSVNAIAGMTEALNKNPAKLTEMVANWQKLQEEQKAVSDSLANMGIDYPEKIAELKKELETAISAMNLSDSAAQEGEKTIEGFIKGAEDMLPAVILAYTKIAEAGKQALSAGLNEQKMLSFYGPQITDNRWMFDPNYLALPAHANGTTFAESAFLAGERGPELIVGRKGSTVFPAAETQKILGELSWYKEYMNLAKLSSQQNSLSVDTALSAYSSSGIKDDTQPIQVNIKFDVAGNVSDETVSKLQSYTEELKDSIIESIKDYEYEKKRRAWN